MGVEQEVSAHYTRGKLEEKILQALRAAGKQMDHLHAEDFAAVDNLHVGGREATEGLAQFMDLSPGMHLLDVGCGLGGPARNFAEMGYQVAGVDLTEEFVQVARSLTKLVKLDDKVKFEQASALKLPFAAATFDRAYMIHVGMNLEDKAGVFREVARVLKPQGRFAIFDIMRTGNGNFEFPQPWAPSPATSFVASVEEYRAALQRAGFSISHERGRRQFGIDFTQRMMNRAATASAPVHGVQVLMGDQMPVMIRNVVAAMQSGVLEPVEVVAILN